MSIATINGHTYSDDADPATGLANGGHATRFVPALADVVVVADQVASNAATAAAAAASAVTGASTSATSTTSLAIGTGAKSLTIQSGKNIVIGMTVKIAVTADGTAWMAGDVTAYNSGNGALVVNAVATSGAGTFAAWTVSLSGPPGTGLPSMVGNAGKFLGNNGAAAAWSATLTEVSGRIGIGVTPAAYKLELRDDAAAIAGVALYNLHSGAAAFCRLGISTDAGGGYIQMGSAAAGAYAELASSGAGGCYVGTTNAAPLFFKTNNIVRGSVSAGGVLDLLFSPTIAGHITKFESGPITLLTGQAVYTPVAHGGSRLPNSAEVLGRCKLAINGIAVGQEVVLPIGLDRTPTQLIIKQSATPTYRTSTGAPATLTAANFDIIVRAVWA